MRRCRIGDEPTLPRLLLESPLLPFSLPELHRLRNQTIRPSGMPPLDRRRRSLDDSLGRSASPSSTDTITSGTFPAPTIQLASSVLLNTLLLPKTFGVTINLCLPTHRPFVPSSRGKTSLRSNRSESFPMKDNRSGMRGDLQLRVRKRGATSRTFSIRMLGMRSVGFDDMLRRYMSLMRPTWPVRERRQLLLRGRNDRGLLLPVRLERRRRLLHLDRLEGLLLLRW